MVLKGRSPLLKVPLSAYDEELPELGAPACWPSAIPSNAASAATAARGADLLRMLNDVVKPALQCSSCSNKVPCACGYYLLNYWLLVTVALTAPNPIEAQQELGAQ